MDADVDGRGTATSITSWRPRSCVWTLKTLNLGRHLLSSPLSVVFSLLPADAADSEDRRCLELRTRLVSLTHPISAWTLGSAGVSGPEPPLVSLWARSSFHRSLFSNAALAWLKQRVLFSRPFGPGLYLITIFKVLRTTASNRLHLCPHLQVCCCFKCLEGTLVGRTRFCLSVLLSVVQPAFQTASL